MWWINSGDPTELHQYLGEFVKLQPPFENLSEVYGKYMLNAKEIQIKGAYYLIGETVPIKLPRSYVYQDYFILIGNDNVLDNDDIMSREARNMRYRWYKESICALAFVEARTNNDNGPISFILRIISPAIIDFNQKVGSDTRVYIPHQSVNINNNTLSFSKHNLNNSVIRKKLNMRELLRNKFPTLSHTLPTTDVDLVDEVAIICSRLPLTLPFRRLVATLPNGPVGIAQTLMKAMRGMSMRTIEKLEDKDENEGNTSNNNSNYSSNNSSSSSSSRTKACPYLWCTCRSDIVIKNVDKDVHDALTHIDDAFAFPYAQSCVESFLNPAGVVMQLLLVRDCKITLYPDHPNYAHLRDRRVLMRELINPTYSDEENEESDEDDEQGPDSPTVLDIIHRSVEMLQGNASLGSFLDLLQNINPNPNPNLHPNLVYNNTRDGRIGENDPDDGLNDSDGEGVDHEEEWEDEDYEDEMEEQHEQMSEEEQEADHEEEEKEQQHEQINEEEEEPLTVENYICPVVHPDPRFSWFKGFGWKIIYCRHCRGHLGFHFVRMNETETTRWAPDSFFGLRLNMLYSHIPDADVDADKKDVIASLNDMVYHQMGRY